MYYRLSSLQKKAKNFGTKFNWETLVKSLVHHKNNDLNCKCNMNISPK